MILEYELNIIKRELLTHGEKFLVRREKLDKYGESTGEYEDIKEICGLYHVEKGYVTREKSDSATVASKGQPKLLILFEDSDRIKKGDIVRPVASFLMKSGSVYTVNDVDNVGGLNVVSDLSLEVRQWE